MRILGIDYGMARIGLALSDPTGMLAQGLSVLQRKSDNQAIDEIRHVVEAEHVDEIVVGFPRNMNGTVGPRAEACAAFADRLGVEIGVPVHLVDERLTTVQAERMLVSADVSRKKRKQVIDSVAATLLLQTYLDQTSRKPRNPSADDMES